MVWLITRGHIMNIFPELTSWRNLGKISISMINIYQTNIKQNKVDVFYMKSKSINYFEYEIISVLDDFHTCLQNI